MNTIPELFDKIKNNIEQIQKNNKWVKKIEISRDDRGLTVWIKTDTCLSGKYFWSIEDAKNYILKRSILRRDYRTPKFKRHTL
jgi:hypothetical protein